MGYRRLVRLWWVACDGKMLLADPVVRQVRDVTLIGRGVHDSLGGLGRFPFLGPSQLVDGFPGIRAYEIREQVRSVLLGITNRRPSKLTCTHRLLVV